MNAFKSQNLANLAIENYSGFSHTQKAILKTILQFGKPIPTDIILNVTGVTRQGFHFSIKRLLKEGYLSRNKIKVFMYQINDEKMQDLINTYTTQQALCQK
jgi:DNA-binding MarR family transcriptional regulator